MDLIIGTENHTIEEITPQEIAWNKEQVKAFVEEIVAPFNAQIFNDQTIPEAKEAHAKLNNFSKRLTAWRIEQGKIYLAPYEKFKNEVSEIANIVDTANKRIDTVIKDYQKRQQDNRRAEIEELYKPLFKDYLKILPLDNIFNPKWLNVGYSMAMIEKELNDTKAKVLEDLAVIAGIESGDEKTALEVEYFKTLNLAATMKEYNRRKEYKAHLEALRKAEPAPEIYSVNAPANAPVSGKDEAPEQTPEKISFNPSVGVCEPKTYTLAFKVTATKEQLLALKAFLKDNGIEYEKA